MKRTSTFGERLAEALKRRGMTAASLAEQAGIQKSTISRYIKGERVNPSADIIYDLAKILEVSEAWLLGYDVPSSPIKEVSRDKLNEAVKLLSQMDDSQLDALIAFMKAIEK